MTTPALWIDVRPDGVAVITYDVEGESVNTLKPSFVDEFGRIFGEVARNASIKAAVLISGKKDAFIAGADIAILKTVETSAEGEAMCRAGHAAIQTLVDCPKPIVAAIHGAALGGGFEIALACDARVLSDDKKTVLGLPEVQLGLVPGLNGLQRLAAIVGLEVALEYGLSGKTMRAQKAKSLGIADDVVAASILGSVAADFALALAKTGPPFRPIALKKRTQPRRVALEQNPLGRALLFKRARNEVLKKTGGHYPAPERVLDVLNSYARRGFDASKAVEAKSFGELVVGDVARRLIEIFFATTALKKDTGVDDPSIRPRHVEKIAVLGTGLMGAGIAYVTALRGIPVRMKDKDDAGSARGHKQIADLLSERVIKNQMTSIQRGEALALLTATTDFSGMRSVDLFIEAVFEDLDLKRAVLAEVESVMKEGAIYASNTSSIPITKIVAASKHPENVVGMHYFSPVHRMPLLEVVKTRETAPDVVATAVALGKKQGKAVIVVSDGVGFYTSRILVPYMNEASTMLAEGASVEQIDDALVAWGWPVGPFTLLDEVGLDVAAHVGPIMLAAFGERMSPPGTSAALVQDGRKGRKNERGFYLYGAATKARGNGKHVDETIYGVLGLPVPKGKKGPVPREEIQMRCSLQLVNEALHCYGEGILRSPRDGDIGAILGLGFPPFRGGPLRYVDVLGAAEVLRRLEGYERRYGARFAPAPSLVGLAKSGEKLYR